VYRICQPSLIDDKLKKIAWHRHLEGRAELIGRAAIIRLVENLGISKITIWVVRTLVLTSAVLLDDYLRSNYYLSSNFSYYSQKSGSSQVPFPPLLNNELLDMHVEQFFGFFRLWAIGWLRRFDIIITFRLKITYPKFDFRSSYMILKRKAFILSRSGCIAIHYGLMKSSIISATCSCCSAKLIEATTSPFWGP